MYDYKAEFHDAVTDLIAQDISDRSERMAAVHALTEAYVDSVGQSPDSAEIERLTDYILREELTDTDRMKTRNTEYPFLSDWQLGRRHDREVSLWVAENLGADGVDYRPKKKRMRSKWEHASVDRNAKIRNQARAAQYRRDTAAGQVVAYNLRETDGELTEPFTQRIGIGARWISDMERRAVAAVNEVVVETETAAELPAAA